jgi:hypothetical protein
LEDTSHPKANQRTEEQMNTRADRGAGIGGISLGGILVIIGIVLMIVWSFWIGLIIALIGLIAFGGFARGKWY